MIIHGIHPVREALEADAARIAHILVVPFRRNPRLQAIVDQAREAGIPVRFERAEILDRKAENAQHQGILAELTGAPYTPLEVLLEKKAKAGWLLVADQVEDPHNLGALVRTAEAAGMDGILFPERRSVQATATVVKASSGAALHFPLVRIGNVARTLEGLKEQGFWVVGLDMGGSDSIANLPVHEPLAIVVGGENRGLRPLVRRKCDLVVGLPMQGRVASLNLSVAAGILIYQILFRKLENEAKQAGRT